jgi:DNA (cytosine-5)-methyltransferase 1
MHLLEQQREEEKPQWLFIENVKNLLSVNGGWDFARVLVEVAKAGYDAQWQVLNSKHFGVPQNRERVFIVCHLRSAGPTKIFPIEGTDGEDCVEIKVIGSTREPVGYGADRERVLGPDGIGPTIRSTDSKEPYKVGKPLGVIHHKGKSVPVEPLDTVPTLTSEHRFHQPEIVIPVDVSTQDDHLGMYVELEDGITAYAVWNEKEQCYIVVRRLTPREYARLMSIPDEYYEKMKFVNSDNQLYKQCGNSVVVDCVYEIAKRMR